MVKFYLLALVVVVILLSIPTTRRVVLDPRAWFRGGSDASASMRRAQAQARGIGDAVTSSRNGRELQKLGQTLVIEAPVEQVGPLLTRAMGETAVIDPVAPLPGESLAWTYSGLTETRFAAVADPARGTVFGVVHFEFSMRVPQGASAADQAVDKASAALRAAGVAFHLVARAYEPGPTITADGPRTAVPLP